MSGLNQVEVSSLIHQNSVDKPSPENIIDLSHQQLRNVPDLSPYTKNINKSPSRSIQNLNLSYNYLKRLPSLPQLKYLDISFNFLTDLNYDSLDCPNLAYLDATANRIQSVDMSNDNYPCLDMLFLRNNKISFFMNCPQNLRLLYLDHNKLTLLSFSSKNLNLLSATNNMIQHVTGSFPRLCFLDLENNKVVQLIQGNKNLLSVNFIDNPVSGHKQYKSTILGSCANIAKINQVFVSPHIRQGFRILREQNKLEETLNQLQTSYEDKIKKQVIIKQQIIQKLKSEEKKVEEDYRKFLQQQRQQMQEVQTKAKKILGEKKLKLPQQAEKFRSQIISEKQGDLLNEKDNELSQLKHQLNEEHETAYRKYLAKKGKEAIINQRLNQEDNKQKQLQRQQRQAKRRKQLQEQQQDSGTDDEQLKLKLGSEEPEEKQAAKNDIKSQKQLSYRPSRELISRNSIAKGFIENQLQKVKQSNNEPKKNEDQNRQSIMKNPTNNNISKQSQRQISANKKQHQNSQETVLNKRCYKFLQKHYSLIV